MKPFCTKNKRWVIEGCYADLLALLNDKANKMLFINSSVQDCIDNCNSRPWEPHKYKSKQAQDANLELLINWIKDYEIRDDEFSKRSHQKLFNAFQGTKHQLTSNQAINQYLIEVKN
ncbi:MAG: hypothetical protein Q9M92_02285 [Enterobacterales bacterium]|nr:hypothetical protein [Enterobacterales bacterium]